MITIVITIGIIIIIISIITLQLFNVCEGLMGPSRLLPLARGQSRPWAAVLSDDQLSQTCSISHPSMPVASSALGP